MRKEMQIFTKYIKELEEGDAAISIANHEESSLYKVILFHANTKTFDVFNEINHEFEVHENVSFFREKERFSGKMMISENCLKETFKSIVGREVYECELDEFSNCHDDLKPIYR